MTPDRTSDEAEAKAKADVVAARANALGQYLAKANGPQRRDTLLVALGVSPPTFRPAADLLITAGLLRKFRPPVRDKSVGDGRRGPLAFVYQLSDAGRATYENRPAPPAAAPVVP